MIFFSTGQWLLLLHAQGEARDELPGLDDRARQAHRRGLGQAQHGGEESVSKKAEVCLASPFLMTAFKLVKLGKFINKSSRRGLPKNLSTTGLIVLKSLNSYLYHNFCTSEA